eukprot:4526412-Prymnesium_polylepis.1
MHAQPLVYRLTLKVDDSHRRRYCERVASLGVRAGLLHKVQPIRNTQARDNKRAGVRLEQPIRSRDEPEGAAAESNQMH